MNKAPNPLDELIEETRSFLDEREKPAPAPKPEASEDAYSDWLFAQGGDAPETPPEPPRRRSLRKKKGGWFWKLLLILLLCAAAFCAVMWFVLAKQPTAERDTLGQRKPRCSTILLAGTDESGTRTDTMLLCRLSGADRTVDLVSLPRDTYIHDGYGVPKLNSVFGAGATPAEGMELLMDKVTETIGFRPDGYVLVELDGFVDLVNAVGGVTFDVPQDMYYDDPAQELHIALDAGKQRLNGEQAMGLVRFRSGYARADLQRVEVQRDFLKAALEQVVRPANLLKAPRLLTTVLTHTTTDMDMTNLVWLAKNLLICDRENMAMETIPGEPRMIGGGSYFVLFPHDSTAALNALCNPYEAEILVEDRVLRG